MSYAPKRPNISKKRRQAIFDRDHGICYLCGLAILDDAWDCDHVIAREISRDDSDDNLAPAHRLCHRAKTKRDVALIAKGNRILRSNGPVELRRKPKRKIQSPGFSKQSRPMQSRSFEKRSKP